VFQPQLSSAADAIKIMRWDREACARQLPYHMFLVEPATISSSANSRCGDGVQVGPHAQLGCT
jgi:hypothetical protein